MKMAGVTINTDQFKDAMQQIQEYFTTLSKLEMLGWGLISTGLVLLVLGAVFL